MFGELDAGLRRKAVDEIFHADAVFYDPNGGVFRGRNEIDRIAGVIKNIMLMPQRAGDKVAANVTLAMLKAGDTPDSLMRRAMGSQAVAAE